MAPGRIREENDISKENGPDAAEHTVRAGLEAIIKKFRNCAWWFFSTGEEPQEKLHDFKKYKYKQLFCINHFNIHPQVDETYTVSSIFSKCIYLIIIYYI